MAPQLAAAGLFASPRISSAKGARGPTATAIHNHALDDLLRSIAIAPASGIDPTETMTKSQKPMAISRATQGPYHRVQHPRLASPKREAGLLPLRLMRIEDARAILRQ